MAAACEAMRGYPWGSSASLDLLEKDLTLLLMPCRVIMSRIHSPGEVRTMSDLLADGSKEG